MASLACTKENPISDNVIIVEGITYRIYHPDAKCVGESYDGADDKYECPHCKVSWWVEYD